MTPAEQLVAIAAAERAHVTRHRTRDAHAADPHPAGQTDPDAARHRRDLVVAMRSYDGVTPVGRRASVVRLDERRPA